MYYLMSTGDYNKKLNLKYSEWTNSFHFRGFMPNSISPLFMFKLIIETQKYYRKIKTLVTKKGKFHFIKWGVFCHLSIKIKILWSVDIYKLIRRD